MPLQKNSPSLLGWHVARNILVLNSPTLCPAPPHSSQLTNCCCVNFPHIFSEVTVGSKPSPPSVRKCPASCIKCAAPSVSHDRVLCSRAKFSFVSHINVTSAYSGTAGEALLWVGPFRMIVLDATYSTRTEESRCASR